ARILGTGCFFTDDHRRFVPSRMNGLGGPMQISRRYTVEGKDPFAAFTFVKRTSRIANPDGTVVFEMKDLLAPEGWSQVAVDILAQKSFRGAGVAANLERVPEDGVPEWIQRSRPAPERGGRESPGDAIKGAGTQDGDTGGLTPPAQSAVRKEQETDARQVF